MSTKIGSIILYETGEIAKALNVTDFTVKEYIKSGKLKGQKIGGNWFVAEESLRDFFNSKFKGVSKRKRE